MANFSSLLWTAHRTFGPALRRVRSTILVVSAIIAPTLADARSWRSSGTIAGFFVDGAPNGMFLRCAGSSVTVNFTGFSERLPSGASYRVGVSVDGIARLLKTRSHTLRGRSVLVHQDTVSNLRPLIEDLRKGKRVEVSTPAGRYIIPLTGSGAALGDLMQRCG